MGTLVRGSASSRVLAAATLSTFDLAVIQHEFGIYGGPDGSEVVDLVTAVDRPVVVVLHTVVPSPRPVQRAIIEKLAARADRLVVQSESARSRLLRFHDVPPDRVCVIRHGAPENDGGPWAPAGDGRSIVLTWGLIGRGKGIEFAIDAFARLRDVKPAPRYVVLGRTHPRVVHAEGEAYRLSLVDRAWALGLEGVVEFDDRYLDTADVLAWIRRAHVVLLPYRSREQVVSGVLVEAIGSGKPVIATQFPHAEELLAAGAGIVVSHDDPEALARALRAALTDAALLEEMTKAAQRLAPLFHWRTVGRAYRDLVTAIALEPARGRA